MPPRSSADANRSPRKRTASREVRSTSPAKLDPPSIADRPKLSPKKRTRKPKKTAESADTNGAHKALQKAVDAEAVKAEIAAAAIQAELAAEEAAARDLAAAEATATELNGTAADAEEPLAENTARVTVTQEVNGEGDDEVTHTNVKIVMPLDQSDEAAPVASEELVAMAEKIVEDAKELQKPAEDGKKQRSRKRKASEVEQHEPNGHATEPAVNGDIDSAAKEVAKANGSSAEPSAKRVRVAAPAEEVQRERMQRRAIMGLSVTLAAGAMIPFLTNFF